MMLAGTARFLLFAAVLVSIDGSRTVQAQCAMCRTAIESSEEGKAMGARLNRGILLLLGAPLGVTLAIGTAMHRSRKRLAARGRPV
jgi:hypothetical protein